MSRTLSDVFLGRMTRRLSIPVLALCLMGAAHAQQAPQSKLKTIYSFTAGADGSFPRGGVVTDDRGNFYGTTSNGGTGRGGVVYQLSKGADGAWTQTSLYAFTGGNDGGNSQAGLLRDGQGNLYGTTYSGGTTGNGVVFKLAPPKKGQTAWKYQVLWSFAGDADGSQPTGTLIMDNAGHLYGTTQWGGSGVVGTVFKLSPPADGQKGWTKTALYNFTGNNDGGQPSGRMLLGSDGNLYGTTAGYGEFNYGNVFKLSPVGGNWQLSVLHAFAGGSDGEVPRDGLIQGPDGRLYGATAGFSHSFGNVFALNTDGSNYQVLWEVPAGNGFEHNGPWQSLSMDASGKLYGATYANGDSDAGQIFQLTPPAPGKTAWTSKVLHAFQMGDANGVYPYTTVLVSKGKLYGTTYGTAGQHGFWPGTVWQIKP